MESGRGDDLWFAARDVSSERRRRGAHIVCAGEAPLRNRLRRSPVPAGRRSVSCSSGVKIRNGRVTTSAHSRIPNQKTLLFTTRTKAIFVANEGGDSSYILSLQDRTLLARRVDRRSLAPIGEPVPLASDVAVFPIGFQASFWASASGNLLAYRTDASDRSSHVGSIPTANGRPRPAPTISTPTCECHRMGPGRRCSWRTARATWISGRGTSHAGQARQTFDAKPDRTPTWSPTGREIAFTSLRTGVWQIFRRDLSGGHLDEQLTSGPGDKLAPDWSHDGKYSSTCRLRRRRRRTSGRYRSRVTASPTRFFRHRAIEPTRRCRRTGSGWPMVSTVRSAGGDAITAFPASRGAVDLAAPRWQLLSTQGGSRPRWSADGHAVLYVSLDDQTSILRADVRTSDRPASRATSRACCWRFR